MAGFGTGYPNWFHCPKWRQATYYRGQGRINAGRHAIKLTRRTRPTKHNGKGHPRKSWTTFEYTCSCGHTGWSSHIDLQHKAEREGWFPEEKSA